MAQGDDVAMAKSCKSVFPSEVFGNWTARQLSNQVCHV